MGNRVVVPAAVNGRPVDALLDTGSSISLLSADLPGHLGGRATPEDTMATIPGIGAGSAMVRFHRFASMDVGQDHIPSPLIAIGETLSIAPDMVLGLDYLKGHRIWISYRARQVFIQ